MIMRQLLVPAVLVLSVVFLSEARGDDRFK